MKIYVIQKTVVSHVAWFEYDTCDCDVQIYEKFEVCKDVGAFDNFEDTFNTIFSCIKHDVDEYLKESPKAEIEEPTVNKDKTEMTAIVRISNTVLLNSN